jgi:hypothetical protein
MKTSRQEFDSSKSKTRMTMSQRVSHLCETVTFLNHCIVIIN